jgi:hypothetical protein
MRRPGPGVWLGSQPAVMAPHVITAAINICRLRRREFLRCSIEWCLSILRQRVLRGGLRLQVAEPSSWPVRAPARMTAHDQDL